MRSQDEIVKDIKSVLEEKVAPSVAAHNGAIGFIDFASDTGVATLKLSGSCSGCAMSKITLQRGVEQTLKHYVPEVTSIVGKIKFNFFTVRSITMIDESSKRSSN